MGSLESLMFSLDLRNMVGWNLTSTGKYSEALEGGWPDVLTTGLKEVSTQGQSVLLVLVKAEKQTQNQVCFTQRGRWFLKIPYLECGEESEASNKKNVISTWRCHLHGLGCSAPNHENTHQRNKQNQCHPSQRGRESESAPACETSPAPLTTPNKGKFSVCIELTMVSKYTRQRCSW